MKIGSNHVLFYGAWVASATLTAWLFWRSEAPEAVQAPVAVVATKLGDVDYRPESLLLWRHAQQDQGVERGDRIATGANGGASLRLTDGRILELGADSLLVLNVEGNKNTKTRDEPEEKVVLTVAKGTLVVRSAPASPDAKQHKAKVKGAPSKALSHGPASVAKVDEPTSDDAAAQETVDNSDENLALEVRVGTQAVDIAQAGDTAKITNTEAEPVRIEAAAAVIATAHKAPILEVQALQTQPKAMAEPVLIATTLAPPPLKVAPPPLPVTPPAKPLTVDDFEPILSFQGKPLPPTIALWTNSNAGVKLPLRVEPPRSIAPDGSWTPMVKAGTQVLTGQASWQGQELNLSLASDGSVEVRGGAQRRNATQAAAGFGPLVSTLKLGSLAGFIGHGVRLTLGQSSGQGARNWIVQRDGLAYLPDHSMLQVYLRDGRDVARLWPFLADASEVNLEFADFGELSAAEGGAWLTRDRTVIARILGFGPGNRLDSVMRSLAADVAFVGDPRSLVQDPSSALIGNSPLWVLNGVYGDRFYQVPSKFLHRDDGVTAYVQRTQKLLFTAKVSILDNRFKSPSGP